MDRIERFPLNPNSILTLTMIDGSGSSTWKICDVIGYGGSCIVYSGKQQSGLFDVERTGIIKEFYPESIPGISRDGEHLVIPKGQLDSFLSKRENFFSGFEKREQHYNIDKDHAMARPFLYGQANGTWYAICDENQGRTLSSCSQGNLTLNRIARIMHSLCEAIGVLHDHALLYLDCKPDNIFFYDVDQIDHIRLFDFDTVLPKRRLHQAQYCSYSDGWAPPEQKNWNVREISEKTDIYSIGAVFFWLLTGRKPTGGTLETYAGTESDLEKIANDTFNWAEEGILQETISPDVLQLVKQIVSHTLVGRANRYDSVSRLDKDFQQLLWLTNNDLGTVEAIQKASLDLKQELYKTTEQAIQQTDSIKEEIRKNSLLEVFKSKRFWIIAIPAVLVIAIIAGIVIGLGSEAAESVFATTEIETGMDSHILLSLDNANHQYEMGLESWRRLDYNRALRDIQAAYDEISSDLGESAIELAKINHSLGCLYLDMGEYQNAYDHLLSAYITFTDSQGEDSLATRAVKAAIARYDYETGDFENALRMTTEIIDHTDTDTERAVAASVLHLQAMVCEGRGQYEEALSIYGDVLEMYNDVSRDGKLLAELANYAYDPSLSVTERDNLSSSIRQIATTYGNLAETLLQMGRNEEALEAVNTGLQLCIENEYAIGTENLITANLYMLSAKTELILNDSRSAYYDIDLALRIEKKIFDYDESYPGLVEVYVNYGDFYSAIFEKSDAFRYYNMAVELAVSSYGENNAQTAEAYHARGRYYLNNGDLDSALDDILTAVQIRQNILGYTHPTTITYLESLAKTQFALGKTEEASISLSSTEYIRTKLQNGSTGTVVPSAFAPNMKKSLLTIEQYSSTSVSSDSVFTRLFVYDNNGQLFAEIAGNANYQDVYYYTFDQAGRLTNKTKISDDASHSFEDIIREYNTDGKLITSSDSETGTLIQKKYLYDDNSARPTKEIWKLESGDEITFHHTYYDNTDGSYTDVRKCISVPERFNDIEDIISQYDWNGNQIRGVEEYISEWGDYWKTETEYAYFDFQSLHLIYVTEYYEYETNTSAYVVLCDLTGKTVEKAYIGNNPKLDFNAQGYLLQANAGDVIYSFSYN